MTVGRICSEDEGKLSQQSIVLEVSRSVGSGGRIKLNIDDISTYSLFPGQVSMI
jgi:DNA polymerase alpha subunit B